MWGAAQAVVIVAVVQASFFASAVSRPTETICPKNCTLNMVTPCACTKSGRLLGNVLTIDFPATAESSAPSKVRRRVYSWLGVPYAQAPMGSLRFQKPIEYSPKTLWLQCHVYKSACIQPRDSSYADTPGSQMWLPNTDMSEDCLYLNIWIPARETSKKLAVMVWIYGGSFSTGSASLDVYDGRYLSASQDVIVVSFNYRLGAHGFLYFPGTTVTGNMGLWDQRFALLWIQENIEKFGGDPKQVTLFGESAGAVSVSLHTVSPWAQNLFKHSIMQSGSRHCNWAAVEPDVALNRSITFANLLECKRPPVSSVISCIKTKSNQQLLNALRKLYQQKNYFDLVFTPVFDKDYLPFSSFNDLLKRGRRFTKKGNQMLGINENEGTYFLLYAFLSNSTWNKFSNLHDRRLGVQGDEAFQAYLHKIIFPFKSNIDDIYNKILLEHTKYHYQENNHFYNTNSETAFEVALDRISSDLSFKCPVLATAIENKSNHSLIYFYLFNYRQTFLPWPKWMGVIHGAEIDFVFGAPFNQKFQRKYYSFTYEEQRLSWYIMKYWANFAKTGDPNIGGYFETFEPKDKYFIHWKNFHGRQGFRALEIAESTHVRWANLSKEQLNSCRLWREFIPQLRKEIQAMRQTQCT